MKPKLKFQKGKILSDATRVDTSKHIPVEPNIQMAIDKGLFTSSPLMMNITRPFRERAFYTVEPAGYNRGIKQLMIGRPREIETPRRTGGITRNDLWALWHGIESYPTTFHGSNREREPELKLNRYSINDNPNKRALQSKKLDEYIRQTYNEPSKDTGTDVMYSNYGLNSPLEILGLGVNKREKEAEQAGKDFDKMNLIEDLMYETGLSPSELKAGFRNYFDPDIHYNDSIFNIFDIYDQGRDYEIYNALRDKQEYKDKVQSLDDPEGYRRYAHYTPHGVVTFWRGYDPEIGKHYISAQDYNDYKLLEGTGNRAEIYSRQYYDDVLKPNIVYTQSGPIQSKDSSMQREFIPEKQIEQIREKKRQQILEEAGIYAKPRTKYQ